ncbi:methyltransferase domain-containing protein [Candidatus Bathyarchaeota archaeon]|nr:MAG: methyltransferase domain-containing protein [Candidatus Bathyarchaeota archaeon]
MTRDSYALERAEKVLRRIEELAKIEYLPIIGPDRGRALAELVAQLKPKRIVEVGTLVGYSTIMMGKELGSDAEIITIEIHREEAKTALRNIKEAGIKPKVHVIVGDASKILPTLRGRFDFVFLDGYKNEYLRHLKSIEGKLHLGSTVVADNAGVYAYSMRDYLNYVRNSGRYKSSFIKVGSDGIEVSVKISD